MKEAYQIKNKLYKMCQVFIVEKHQTIKNIIASNKKALLSETKSSVGDKHETGRAMLQLEMEKTGQQLTEVQKLNETLAKMDVFKITKNICLGSLVYTTQSNYFISISAGKLTINNVDFFAISPDTPIGQLLLSKSMGDEIIFKGSKFKIKEII